jgi:hypothetical protein
MTQTAPVCFVSTNQQIGQPPGVQLPALPVATDLPSALSAIQAMTNMLNLLTGQTGQSGAQGNVGAAGAAGAGGKNQKGGRFQEVAGSRVTQDIQLTSDDGSVTFTIKQINAITWQDTITGEQITWNR